jgi:molecular chaperone GrpE
MADSKKNSASEKKVKTSETAAETIVGEASAEIKDATEPKVEVTETEEVPQEKAEQAKPKPVPKENRRGSKALRDENEKLKERCADAEAKYTRLLAECENIRQRNEKEASKLYDVGAKDVLNKLLPVVDNFERAMAAIPEEDKDRPFESGVANIYKQLMTGLEGIGVKPMDCAGEQFDPTFHNAVMHVEDESYEENVIVEEMQKGYMYKDQVLRFSMVKVAN